MKMDPRNKRALVILAAVGAVFVVVMLILGVGRGGNPETDLKRAGKLREDFFKNLDEYKTIGPQIDQIDQKIALAPLEFDLFGALDKIEKELDIQGNIKNKTKNASGGTDFYSEDYITMDLQKITLDKLVALLQKIEEITAGNQAFVRVSQLTVKRSSYKKEERTLDVTVKVTLYAKPGAAAP